MCVGPVLGQDKGFGSDLTDVPSGADFIPPDQVEPNEEPQPSPEKTVLPRSFALPRKFFYDQGNTPRCVGYAGAGLASFHEYYDDKVSRVFDPTDFYNGTRARPGCSYGGGATSTKCGLDYFKITGALIKGTSTRKKISKYYALSTRSQIKWTIYNYHGAWISSRWYSNWGENDYLPPSGIMPAPGTWNGSRHSYLLVGWNDTIGCWLVHNSWGTHWGLGGRAWMKYPYLNLADSSQFQAWRTYDIND